MLSLDERYTVEEAGKELLPFIFDPRQWVSLSGTPQEPQSRPGENPRYQRKVGSLSICASVDVSPSLYAFLRVAFRGPGLTPLAAADYLEAFLKSALPLLPNTEWQVEVDSRRWIHFIRRYAAPPLQA